MPLFGFFKKTNAAQPKPRREPFVLTVDGLTAEVLRKPMRTLRLVLVPPDGRLRVSAPLRATRRDIAAFLTARKEWILAQRQRMLQEAAVPPPRYEEGERLPWFGQEVVLALRFQGKVVKAGLVSPGVLELRGPSEASVTRREAAVQRWYARELLAAALVRLPSLHQAMGVESSGILVRAMRSRWGSCNLRTRRITLALELARRPVEGLEYVLVHELAHLTVRSHGKRFKSILDRHLPDWRQRRKALNERRLPG